MNSRCITHGCYVRALRSQQQLCEIFERLQLARSARPFTLCPSCNAALHAVPKAQEEHLVPPRARELHRSFSTCETCGRVFWEGEHWQSVRALVGLSKSDSQP